MKDLLPFEIDKESKSIIKVIGVGGGGGNAVNYMYEKGITDVDFLVSNTDEQVLKKSPVPIKIHLGKTLTEGLGAGNQPEKGKEAAIESLEDIKAAFGDNTKMVFITAGMGGGTGTGAAPVIAEAAQEMGILTVGVVTIPFEFEGNLRINQAVEGVREISQHVDSLIVINNERLREIYGNFGISEAFSKADDVLTVAVRGIAEIITKEGYVNVDFADVNTVMRNSGVAIMGRAETEGENRATQAIEDALNSPLLSSNDITGTKNILVNMTHGEEELTTDEISEINGYAQDAAGQNANLIWGLNKDESLGKKINVTIIATGFETDVIPELYMKKFNKVRKDNNKKVVVNKKSDNKVFTSGAKLDLTDDSADKWDKSEEKPEPVLKETKKQEELVEQNEKPLVKKERQEEYNSNLEKAMEKMAIVDKTRKERGMRKGRAIDYSNIKNIDEIENEPAFKRRLSNSHQDSYDIQTKAASRYIINDENDLEMRPNSFLHDNVD